LFFHSAFRILNSVCPTHRNIWQFLSTAVHEVPTPGPSKEGRRETMNAGAPLPVFCEQELDRPRLRILTANSLDGMVELTDAVIPP